VKLFQGQGHYLRSSLTVHFLVDRFAVVVVGFFSQVALKIV